MLELCFALLLRSSLSLSLEDEAMEVLRGVGILKMLNRR